MLKQSAEVTMPCLSQPEETAPFVAISLSARWHNKLIQTVI